MVAATLFLLELMLAVSAAVLSGALLGYRPIIAATIVLPTLLVGSRVLALV
jgi:hypothetical protein